MHKARNGKHRDKELLYKGCVVLLAISMTEEADGNATGSVFFVLFFSSLEFFPRCLRVLLFINKKTAVDELRRQVEKEMAM